MSEFHGRNVFVTGATSGIGRGIALAFAAEGARIGVVGRRRDAAEAVAEEITRAGGEAVVLVADVREPATIGSALDDFLAGDLALHVAINAAGLDIGRPLAEHTLEDFAAIFETNTRAVFVCLREEILRMRATSGGAIITVTSVAALRPFVSNSLYNASKSAAAMLTRTAAVEEAPHGIRINEIAPGPVDTPMLRGFFAEAAGAGWDIEKLRAQQPVRRLGVPEDIAQAALFLASARSSYICGACLPVDGGMHLVV
jgi:NAD(P)-dependent dehydrogenase (short-subunit alcohol dehydrogenase family)